jgi:hypothetical protein
MRAAAHHRGTHRRRAREIVALAYADPATQCQAQPCRGWGSRTLVEHPHAKSGREPRWQAGHVIDGQIDGELRPEVDVCNTSNGARLRNAHSSNPTSRQW